MTPAHAREDCDVAIIGGGPAGLMAAEAAAARGANVAVYDAMASCGRKFLLAGKGGLNLTHEANGDALLARYGDDLPAALRGALEAFDTRAVRAWAAGLGIETFVGSSGRVFPADMKAAPLLRRWLERLRRAGVSFHPRHRWCGWDGQALLFASPEGDVRAAPRATVLALGGASWPRLGSDGGWVSLLQAEGADVTPLTPANCGFECAFSSHLRDRHAGQVAKNVVLECTDSTGRAHRAPGDLVITDYGFEGGCIYALSRWLRDAIAADGAATLRVDLAPGYTRAALEAALARPRGKRSLGEHLRRAIHLDAVRAALVFETAPVEQRADPVALATHIKAARFVLTAPRSLAEAISTAGGVRFAACDERLMLRAKPGVFVAGEMLDWEAPTGGYLLTGCLATGSLAGAGAGDRR
ncbi:MAG: TIGR03862 family flavoprotein [Gammaproteobacteria bacterium]|nr:TIGR03862 family flavoprotein [Gammaproteobacteria bacterium]MCP5199742.1 TIGR03862 family flavoprotein [Gammaproteobacteria bacterium]